MAAPKRGVSLVEPAAVAATAGAAKGQLHKPSAQQPSAAQRLRAAALFVVPLAVWMFASSALVVLNKTLMVDQGFGYPMFLTATGQAASAAGGAMLSALGLVKSRAPPPLRFVLTRCVPVAAATAASLFLGNYSYLSLSMAFIQILKAFTPAVTYLVGAAAGLEPLTAALGGSVACIAAGTAVSTWAEQAGGHFSWLGFSSFMASVGMESVRVLALQAMLSGQRYGPADVSVYVGLPSAALTLGASALLEGRRLREHGFPVLAANRGLYAATMACTFVLNAAVYWAIQACGGLTLKVAGCVKNALVMCVGVLQGEALAAKEVAGYALSMLGFALYTAAQRGAHAGDAARAKHA